MPLSVYFYTTLHDMGDKSCDMIMEGHHLYEPDTIIDIVAILLPT